MSAGGKKKGGKKPTAKAAAAAAAKAAVTWRDGVHIEGTPLWCDARHAREVCFVSHAGVPEAHRHRQVIATAETVALLAAGGAARKRAQATLTPPYSRPFSLGELRVELFPSGYMPGAASLSVEVKGTRVVYAGPTAPGVRTPEWAGQVRPCDVLVLDGTFAAARFRFPARAAAGAELDAFVERALADGVTPVLLAAAQTVAPALAARLAGRAPLAAHASIADAAGRLRTVGVALPPMTRLRGAPAPGSVVLWPPALRDNPGLLRLRRARFALVDGTALDPAALARAKVDTAIAWSDRAGHDDLIELATLSGATQVFMVGGTDDTLVAALARRGVLSATLGPPRQLALF